VLLGNARGTRRGGWVEGEGREPRRRVDDAGSGVGNSGVSTSGVRVRPRQTSIGGTRTNGANAHRTGVWKLPRGAFECVGVPLRVARRGGLEDGLVDQREPLDERVLERVLAEHLLEPGGFLSAIRGSDGTRPEIEIQAVIRHGASCASGAVSRRADRENLGG